MSSRKHKLFAELLVLIGEEERQVEIIRQVLIEQKTFSMDNIFRRFNKRNKDGYIIEDELDSFLDQVKIRHNVFETKCLMIAFDYDQDGLLSYWDLMYSILPYK